MESPDRNPTAGSESEPASDEKSRDQPWQIVHLAKVAADGRQSARQHRLIDRAEEYRQHHADRDKPLVAMAQRLRIAGCRMLRALRGHGNARKRRLAGKRLASFRGAQAALVVHEDDYMPLSSLSMILSENRHSTFRDHALDTRRSRRKDNQPIASK